MADKGIGASNVFGCCAPAVELAHHLRWRGRYFGPLGIQVANVMGQPPGSARLILLFGEEDDVSRPWVGGFSPDCFGHWRGVGREVDYAVLDACHEGHWPIPAGYEIMIPVSIIGITGDFDSIVLFVTKEDFQKLQEIFSMEEPKEV